MLAPLTPEAAWSMFADIADHETEHADVQKILSFTDNVPLAISLMAHLADSEGCTSVLSRWEKDKTYVLSEGSNKGSNLDLSIQVSISSPRIHGSPQSIELLGLLALLPDGIADIVAEAVASSSSLSFRTFFGLDFRLLGTFLSMERGSRPPYWIQSNSFA